MSNSEGKARLPRSEEDVIVRRTRIEPGTGGSHDEQHEVGAIPPVVGTLLLVAIIILVVLIAGVVATGGL